MTAYKNKVLISIKILFVLLFSLCLFVVSGCVFGSGQQQARLAVPEGLPDKPAILPEFAGLHSSEGSLFSGQSRFFFEDNKACMVGDTVVVDIIENSSSSMKVSTDSSRKSGIDIGVSSFFGKMPKFAQRYGITDTSKLLGTTYDSKLQGEGESDRAGQVTASIAARVSEI
ncbi:MAG: flagellar basal body L-ring protein FlgH, partial [Desulfobacula sp.]|nr:flagellar basal body L-ring protein FlgH [Desulfobacula sp.]